MGEAANTTNIAVDGVSLDGKGAEQIYEKYKLRQEKVAKLQLRVAQLLADEKCTMAEAEDVLTGTKQIVRQQTIVQGDFNCSCCP